jgi:hypothetical protein
MKRLTTTILIIVLLLVVLQTINKSGARYIPILWVLLNIVPVIYLIMAKAAKHNLVYILGYALLALATVLSAEYILTSFQMGSDQYLLTSFAWLIFAQLGVWGQYYSTRYRVPAGALSLGIEFPAKKSASIRALMMNGRIEEAVEQLTAGEELNQEQKVIVTNFAYRFSKVIEQQTLGLLTTEQVTVEKNKIVTSILRYV